MTESAFDRGDPDLQRKILDAMPGGVVQWFQTQEADLGHPVAAGLRVR